MKQCPHCPWKKSTNPNKDIPNGYSRTKHKRLRRTLAGPIANPAELNLKVRVMACHESPIGAEYPCVGWLSNQLNEGNNIPLQMLALDGRFKDLQLDGEQHEIFEATLG